MSIRSSDARFVRMLIGWFRAHARELPWREADGDGRRDPWRVFVSEAMLQQTQVSRVLEKFDDFCTRFPTPEKLARAREQTVLAAWSGLGYYRRARRLHAAAKRIVKHHRGAVPDDVEALRALPGVGRYTAGAIASLAFGQAAPIVDGNVARVLLRIEGRNGAADERKTMDWAWRRAEALVREADRTGDAAAFNEGLMELGALVCAPSAPKCLLCPLSETCQARAAGRQEEIPRPRVRARPREVHHATVVVTDRGGRLLLERRPETGLWAGMWQAPTIERQEGPPSAKELAALLGESGIEVALEPEPAERFNHATTHRLVRFGVWRAEVSQAREGNGRSWRSRSSVARLALANPHRRILLGESGGAA